MMNGTNMNDINNILMLQKMQEMMSGNNNSYLNYNGGTEQNRTGWVLPENGQPINNMNSKQLEKYIADLSKKMAKNKNKLNINESLLENLDSSQLDDVIKKLSMDMSGLNEILNNDEQEDNEQDLDIEPEPEPEKPKSKKKKAKKSKTKEKDIVDEFQTKKQELVKLMQQMKKMSSPSRSNLKEVDVPSNDDIADSITDPELEFYDLNIKSEDLTSEANYNDYLVDLENSYNNVGSLRLQSFKLPKVHNNITDDNNVIKYVINGDEKRVGLEPGIYDLETIIKGIDIAFSRNKDNLTIYKDNSGYITIKHKDRIVFDLINDEESLTKSLGFKNDKYSGKYAYKSERVPNIDPNNKVVLCVKIDGVIDEETPLMTIDLLQDPEEQCPVELSLMDDPIQNLNNFVIKFKDKDGNLYDFHGEPHELNFRIGTL